jgi:hypothetical protein
MVGGTAAEPAAGPAHHDAVIEARLERARKKFAQRHVPSVTAEGYIQFSDYPYATATIRFYAVCVQQVVLCITYVAGGALTATSITMLVVENCAYAVMTVMAWCRGPQIGSHVAYRACMVATTCSILYLLIAPIVQHESRMPFRSRTAFTSAAGVVNLMGKLILGFEGSDMILRCERITSLWPHIWRALTRALRFLDVFSDIGLARLYFDAVRAK